MKRLAVVPATPLLLPAYASQVDPIPSLRAAVDQALDFAGPDATRVRFPEAHRSSPAVGVECVEPGHDPGERTRPDRVVLVADGSARRQEEGGPGTFDPRAEAFDLLVADALAAGDPAALAALDAGLAAELMVDGLAGFHWLGTFPTPASARLLHAEAPYGVGYFVALWEW